MRQRAVVVVAVMLGGGSLAWAADPAPFTFSTPPGWLNVSRDSSAADRARIPAAMLEQLDSGKFAFFAADVDHVDDGFMVSVNAVLRMGRPFAMTMAALDVIQGGAAKNLKEMGFEYQPVKKEIVKIGGVDCGRTVGNLRTPNNDDLTTVGYVIPGRGAAVTLTFTSPRNAFPRYEAIFDAAARQTRGAASPPVETPLWVYGIVGSASAAIASLAARRAKQKKASTTVPR
jgi:hypothetical protein